LEQDEKSLRTQLSELLREQSIQKFDNEVKALKEKMAYGKEPNSFQEICTEKRKRYNHIVAKNDIDMRIKENKKQAYQKRRVSWVFRYTYFFRSSVSLIWNAWDIG
jgi:hypothetical protein